jgi:DNA-binding response OmpR family regulator
MLVDFVMPRMNGYQLCMALRERNQHVPVVLMSAKGDRIRGKFVQQTGALDAITKPFDARGLIAVIESALAKRDVARKEKSDKKLLESNRPSEAPKLEDDSAVSRESWGDKTNRDQTLLRLSDRLAGLLVEHLTPAAGKIPPKTELAAAFAQALSPAVTSELALAFGAASLNENEREILSGDLASISIAEVLQLLEAQRKTGALTLGHGKASVSMHLSEGNLDFAYHTGLPPEFLLGRYLVDTKALSRKELDSSLEQAREAGKKLGGYLVSEEVVSEETLMSALRLQTTELVYEVVRWRKGRFRFTQTPEDDSPDAPPPIKLGLRTAGLVMEGFRRVDEWRLIEDSFDFGDVLFRDELYIENLSDHQEIRPDEKRALELIDGDRTVGSILDAMGGSSFESCKILYRLLNGRLVKRRVV